MFLQIPPLQCLQIKPSLRSIQIFQLIIFSLLINSQESRTDFQVEQFHSVKFVKKQYIVVKITKHKKERMKEYTNPRVR